MRILHLLNHCYNGNGHVHVAVDLACAQVEAGHVVTVASSGGPYVDLLVAHGVRHVMLPDVGAGRRSVQAVRAALATIRLARDFRPSVIHAHMMTVAVLGFLASKRIGVPLVTTMHNSFDRQSALMRLGTVVVAVSEAERALLLSRGYCDNRVVTVLNGTLGSVRERWESDQIGTLARPSVMTLSGLHPRKGINDVIDAFVLAHTDYPDWHLNIVGNGPDWDRLTARVDELGMARSIHLLGSTRLPGPALAQSEIFASGSLAEPFGLVVAEARAAGCAIVATAVGGVPEVLDHGRAGLLTPAGDPVAMAESFQSLMADSNLLTEWQAKARWGSEHFSVHRMATDYQRVYEEVRGLQQKCIGGTQ